MDYGSCNVRADANACDVTRECAATLRESVLNADSARKIPRRIAESNLRRHRAGTMLYQLIYIPTPLDISLKKNVTPWHKYTCNGSNTLGISWEVVDYCDFESLSQSMKYRPYCKASVIFFKYMTTYYL